MTNVNFYQYLNCHNIYTVSLLYSRTVLPVCKPCWWFSVSPSEKVEYKCFWSDCKCNRREGLWDDNSQCWRNCRERNKGTQMDWIAHLIKKFIITVIYKATVFTRFNNRTIIWLIFKDTFPSSNAFVTWFEIPATSTHDGKIFIPVDDYIKSLKIMVKNVFSLSELVCYYPNGNGFFQRNFISSWIICNNQSSI